MNFFKACIVGIHVCLVIAPLADAQSIVGAWAGGNSTREGGFVVLFFPNGFFVQIDNVTPLDAPGAFDGFERGTYSWDPMTGAFISSTLQDLDGDAGYSSLNGLTDVTATLTGDTLRTVVPGRGSFTLTRVTGASPIVGAWGSVVAAADNSTAFVFLPNGVYFTARDGDAVADPGGQDGIEHGTYAWNPASGGFTSNAATPPFVDTNGKWGLSDPQGAAQMKISGDLGTLTYSDGRGSSAFPRAGVPSAAVINYQGLWWNAPAGSESGWGINLAHQGDLTFATWFTYDGTGKAWWLSMTAVKTSSGVYTGDLYQTRGPAFNAVPFLPADVTATKVGTGTLTFSSVSDGTFAYVVNGIAQTKPITREVFGALPSCTAAPPDLAAAINYQDLWWAAPGGAESGWGVNFTQQGDIIFATWFTYDLDGTPMWLSATVTKTSPGTFTGLLYRTTGPAFNAVPFLPASVSALAVGTLTLTFANGNSGTFAYVVNGVTQSKPIARQLFSATGTVCL